MSSLFRSEVIEHGRRRLMGEVVVLQPVTQAMMTAALTVFSVAGLAYLVTGTYAKTETVPGYVAPTGGLAQIYASHGGIVTEVPVHEGDFVEKGGVGAAFSRNRRRKRGPGRQTAGRDEIPNSRNQPSDCIC